MAISTNIVIPYPVLTGGEFFDVVIKDSAGAIVFSSATETNTLFTVSLAADSYTMLVTFNGATNAWCFTVSECDTIFSCPQVTNIEVTRDISGGTPIYYVEITVDYGIVSPFVFGCPFQILVLQDTTFANYDINSFSDFTSNVGLVYTKKIMIYGSSTQVKIFRANCPTIPCANVIVGYSCTGPHFPTFTGRIEEISGSLYIPLKFTDSGTTCSLMTINYTEISYIGGGIPDAGTVTVDVSTLGAFPALYFMPINPTGSEAIYAYAVSAIDCCGNSASIGTVLSV